MDAGAPETVTRLLQAAAEGGRDVTPELFPIVYDELRALAASYFADERADHTLQPTALVNEAFIRLVGRHDEPWEGRRHFFAAAAQAMRHLLVDHARARGRAKRGGGRDRAPLDAAAEQPPVATDVDLEALDAALTRLAAMDDRKARQVELRFFAGLTAVQAAECLGISRTTADDDWRLARAWLSRELERAEA